MSSLNRPSERLHSATTHASSHTISHEHTAKLMAGAMGCFVYPMAPHSHKVAVSAANPAEDTAEKANLFWKKLVSSSLGGATGALICYPFEGLKKRLQSGQSLKVESGALFAKSSPFHPRELFRGATPFAASVTLATTSSMMFNKILKSMPFFQNESSSKQAQAALASGMLGALVGSTPVENVILTQQLKKVGPFEAVKIMTRQSLLRPWVGLPELMIREAGFAFVMLYGASEVQRLILQKTKSETSAFIGSLGMGILGAAATQPFDTIATIRQKADGKIGTKDAVVDMFKKYGYSGFFKGLSQRVFLFTGCALIIPRVERALASQLA